MDQRAFDKIRSAEVGDIVTFGTYEQDSGTSNSKEDIEWLVLAKENNRILVISDKALDCQPYNPSWSDVTWETCSLCEWLNNDFVNDAFSDDEKAMIPTVTVSANKNPKYDTDPGNTAKDRVFLLSIVEAEKYFTSDEARKCIPTEYALSCGAAPSDDGQTKGGEDTCYWWLRSPGCDQSSAAYVCVVAAGSRSTVAGSRAVLTLSALLCRSLSTANPIFLSARRGDNIFYCNFL